MAFHKININSTDFELAPKKVKSKWGISSTNENLFIPYLSNGPGPGMVQYGSNETDYVAAEILVANNFGALDNPSFFYNPSQNAVGATKFIGDLDGNATSATTASKVTLTQWSTAEQNFYIPYASSLNGNNSLYTDGSIYYCPKTNTLTADKFNGTLNGSVIVTAATANATYYVSFVNGTSGARKPYVDSNLYYNPSTNTLTTTQVDAKLNGPVQTTSTSTNASYYISFVNGSSTNMRYSYVNSGLYYNPYTNDLTVSNGKVNATEGFYETSDERLKDFQEDIEVNFSYLYNIPKKYYSFKDDATYTRHIGTSAQEVQKYYPELVNTDETGYLTMNYDKLSVVALKAIDVLHEEVTELKKENAELKERLARLEELILNNR